MSECMSVTSGLCSESSTENTQVRKVLRGFITSIMFVRAEVNKLYACTQLRNVSSEHTLKRQYYEFLYYDTGLMHHAQKFLLTPYREDWTLIRSLASSFSTSIVISHWQPMQTSLTAGHVAKMP